jgi:hypothetical protein
MYATELRRPDVTFPSARTDALDETDPLSGSFATATSALGDLERAVYVASPYACSAVADAPGL